MTRPDGDPDHGTNPDHGSPSPAELDPCSAEAFEAKYRDQGDPWAFATSAYEQGRYAALVDALPRPRYRSAWEPACSIGELTARLAPRCDRLRATEISPTALEQARRRVQAWPHVELDLCPVDQDPTTDLDLIAFSEVGYYFDRHGLDRLIGRLIDALAPDGDLVACHWLGHSDDHRLHGSAVHEALAERAELLPLHHHQDEGWVVDVWRLARPSPSPA